MKNQYITLTSIILALGCFASVAHNASAQPDAGRLLSRVHDGGRVQRTESASPAGAGNTGLGWYVAVWN